MRRLVGQKVKHPSEDLYRKNPDEAERLEAIAENATYQNQTDDFFRTRKIITDELNKRLGLNLPPDNGTTSFAAAIYDMQQQKGLTNPQEGDSM